VFFFQTNNGFRHVALVNTRGGKDEDRNATAE